MTSLLFIFILIEPKFETRINLAAELEIYSKHAVFAVSSAGTLAIVDSKEYQVVFSNGTTHRRAGRSGKGPREFSHIVSVLWDETQAAFLVCDTGNNRISAWSETGQFISEDRMPAVGSAKDFQMTASKSFFYSDSYESPKWNQHYLYFKSNAQSQAQVVWQFEFPPDWKPTNIRPQEPRPYIIFMHWDVDLRYGVGSNFVVVWPHNNQLVLLDLMGKPLNQSIPMTLPRYPITQEQVDHMLLGMRDEKMRTQTRKHAVVPDFWPAVKHLIVDEQDRIWVFGFPAKVNGPHPFQVINQSSKILGEGTIPHEAQYVKGHRLYSSYWNPEDECLIDIYSFQMDSK